MFIWSLYKGCEASQTRGKKIHYFLSTNVNSYSTNEHKRSFWCEVVFGSIWTFGSGSVKLAEPINPVFGSFATEHKRFGQQHKQAQTLFFWSMFIWSLNKGCEASQTHGIKQNN